MTITITIEAHPDRGSMRPQIDEAMQALGFQREIVGYPVETKFARVLAETNDPAAAPGMTETVDKIEAADAAPEPAARRERGKPGPGHARRTKAEIAEDEAADKADAAVRAAGEETGAIVADKQVEEESPLISSGGPRVDPEDPDDDDEATAAQDAADEAAETAAQSGGKVTLDDVRNALGQYVTKYGMPAAQEDGPKVITLVCGAGKVKLSDIPDDQTLLSKVRDGVLEMVEKNPFGRKAVA